jgi:hypothetical protein
MLAMKTWGIEKKHTFDARNASGQQNESTNGRLFSSIFHPIQQQ